MNKRLQNKTQASGSLPRPCSALSVAQMIAESHRLLDIAVESIEARANGGSRKWTPRQRTRSEAERKYKLREARITLKNAAIWLRQDAEDANGGWPNAEVSDPATQ